MNRKTCGIQDCDREVFATDLCQRHYLRKRRYGDPLHITRDEPGTDLKTRLMDPKKWLIVDRGYGTPCWEWVPKNKSVEGYGRIKYQRRGHATHRLMYEMHKGEIPPRNNILHRCDNPPCGNPDHLFVGTQQDNIADMVSKGRQSAPRGLTDDQVRAIRAMVRGGMRQSEVVTLMGIESSTVSHIVTRKLYKDVV